MLTSHLLYRLLEREALNTIMPLDTLTPLTMCTTQHRTVPKVIDFPRYCAKCSGENEKLRGIFQVVSSFPLHFVLYHYQEDPKWVGLNIPWPWPLQWEGLRTPGSSKMGWPLGVHCVGFLYL